MRAGRASFSSQCLIYFGSPITITLNPVYVPSGVCLAIVFGLILLPFRNTTTLQQHPPRLQKGRFNIHRREVCWALWLPWWWQWPRCPDTRLVPGPSCCFGHDLIMKPQPFVVVVGASLFLQRW